MNNIPRKVKVEFWCNGMSLKRNGIKGWFYRELFWSDDGADNYSLSEIARFKVIES